MHRSPLPPGSMKSPGLGRFFERRECRHFVMTKGNHPVQRQESHEHGLLGEEQQAAAATFMLCWSASQKQPTVFLALVRPKRLGSNLATLQQSEGCWEGDTYPFDFDLKGQGGLWRNAIGYSLRPVSQGRRNQKKAPAAFPHAKHPFFPALQLWKYRSRTKQNKVR